MPYRDKEKRKKIKREWAQKKRKGSTEGSTGSTELDKNVDPCVDPCRTRVDPCSDDMELLKGEIRTFRQALLSLNDLLKRVESLESENRVLEARINELSEPGERIKSGKQHKDIKKPNKSEDQIVSEDSSWCAKHSRFKFPGKPACC